MCVCGSADIPNVYVESFPVWWQQICDVFIILLHVTYHFLIRLHITLTHTQLPLFDVAHTLLL